MPIIDLAYGHTTVSFKYDPAKFEVLLPDERVAPPLSDAEIGHALDHPIESQTLEEIVDSDDTVLIVVSDATRATGSAQIINLLVRRLIQTGVLPHNLAIIFANGIHRAVTQEEKIELLTPFIAQRIRTLNHDAYDPAQLVKVGMTDRGIPIELNRALTDFSKVILTGAVGFHYFAGFTGGRKAVCPGLAASNTIKTTHMLAMDFERGGRREGVAAGRLNGNAVNEECERIAAIVNPVFLINAIVDERGRPEHVFAGNWRAAHRRACEVYAAEHSRRITEKREVVIASCGGAPYDINLIQAHKALDMASHACTDGGTIILLAECGDGPGRADFSKWFESETALALETKLRNGYEVNGQTAWALLSKTERFRVHLITNLDQSMLRRLRIVPSASLDRALATVSPDASGYIMPRGAALLPVVG